MDIMSLQAERLRRNWLSIDSESFDDFKSVVSAKTNLSDWPFASSVDQNVPVYSGSAVRDAVTDSDERQSLMAEWIEALMSGPGVIAIAAAFDDTSIIDTANTVFNTIIDEQRSSNAGGGDHFAKPGANDRVWNSLEKHCLAHPQNFIDYYANETIALASEAWLGVGYQITAQVNRVNPGGDAQTAHRDYHLGFMSAKKAACYPAHVHQLSPALTLQGGVAHCDMPHESGPTLYLPYSQKILDGYLTFGKPDYQAYFNTHCSQLELKKGDVLFFNPALMHAAGCNRSSDIYRMANLLQVSSAFGRSIESVDRTRMISVLYPELTSRKQSNSLTDHAMQRVIAASAEGYPFPTNLDLDLPVGGLAPKSQAALLHDALESAMTTEDFNDSMRALLKRQLA